MIRRVARHFCAKEAKKNLEKIMVKKMLTVSPHISKKKTQLILFCG